MEWHVIVVWLKKKANMFPFKSVHVNEINAQLNHIWIGIYEKLTTLSSDLSICGV